MATEMERRARAADGAAYLLPEAAHWEALVLRRAGLARAFALPEAERGAACAELGLGAGDLAAVLAAGCPNAIAFVERADRLLETRAAPAPVCDLDRALADLDAIAARIAGQDAARAAA
jgi:hypothetical protein